MLKPKDVLKLAAADMNDSAQTNYTNEALLPYFSMALKELEDKYVENDLPITIKTKAQLDVDAGITEIPFASTTQTCVLPPDLIEPEEIWESEDDGQTWTPVVKVDKINPNIASGQNLSAFGVYQWQSSKIILPEITTDAILQIDYLRKLFPVPFVIEQIDVPIETDALLFLSHKTAALCAALSAQDETRAGELSELADQAIERELNIPTKGRQQIATRRRPFRAAYKSAARSW